MIPQPIRRRAEISNALIALLGGIGIVLLLTAGGFLFFRKGSAKPGSDPSYEKLSPQQACVALADAPEGCEIHNLSIPGEGATLVHFAADPQYAFIARGKSAWYYELATRTPLHTFSGHTLPITSMALSRDGKVLLTGSRDGTARIWQAKTGKRLRQIRFQGSVTSVDLTPDGLLALISLKSVTARDGRRLGKNAIYLHDAKTGKNINDLDFPTSPVLRISNDGVIALGSCEDQPLMVWLLSLRPNPQLDHKPDVRGQLCLTPIGKRNVLLGAGNGTIVHWDTENKKPLGTFLGHRSSITDMSVIGTGSRFVSVSAKSETGVLHEPSLRIWETATGKEVGHLRFPSGVTSVSVSSNGTRALTGEEDGSVRLLELQKVRGGR